MIRQVLEKDLNRCFEIEQTAYSGDEAASKEKISTRINTYPEGFIIKQHEGVVIGFINAGACHQVELSDEDFKELIGHDATGKHIVIMSVVVHPKYQRQGFANELMQSFIEKMQKLGKSNIYLICQTDLINMYASYGFKYICESGSNHGGLAWHEMVLDLT